VSENSGKCLLRWVGGKRLLRKKIASLIPMDIKLYAEPFGGAGWVLFFRDKWADVEVYNDLDGRLVNLFRIVKYHPKALVDELHFMLRSREMFEQALEFEGYTDIQRAARFLFLVSTSFGGSGKVFGTGRIAGGLRDITKLISRIEVIHERLKEVCIEHLDFEELILKYDFKDAFFYCDPPYTSGAGYDVVSTKGFDHERLRDCLGKIKGRFLLSYDDLDKARDLYEGFNVLEVTRRKGINNINPNGREYKELLIANYDISKQEGQGIRQSLLWETR